MLNFSNLVLVPKVPNLEQISQFCPISLYNFSCKVLSKFLSDRLKIHLLSLISQHQSAFVHGHQILDNIFVVHEAFHYLKK